MVRFVVESGAVESAVDRTVDFAVEKYNQVEMRVHYG